MIAGEGHPGHEPSTQAEVLGIISSTPGVVHLRPRGATHPMTDLSGVLKNLTPQQAAAVWAALDQYTENCRDYVDGEDEPDLKVVEDLRAAQQVLDLMNAEIVAKGEA